MSVLITMGCVPISVTTQKVVIIVSVLLDISSNLTTTIVKVSILLYISLSNAKDITTYIHAHQCNYTFSGYIAS